MQMTANIGKVDRIARIVIGALLVILALTGTVGVWGWLGVILLGTAFVKFCPLYRILGIQTCSTR